MLLVSVHAIATFFFSFSLQYRVSEVNGRADSTPFMQQSLTSTVRQLEWREDSDYIYVATDDAVCS